MSRVVETTNIVKPIMSEDDYESDDELNTNAQRVNNNDDEASIFTSMTEEDDEDDDLSIPDVDEEEGDDNNKEVSETTTTVVPKKRVASKTRVRKPTLNTKQTILLSFIVWLKQSKEIEIDETIMETLYLTPEQGNTEKQIVFLNEFLEKDNLKSMQKEVKALMAVPKPVKVVKAPKKKDILLSTTDVTVNVENSNVPVVVVQNIIETATTSEEVVVSVPIPEPVNISTIPEERATQLKELAESNKAIEEAKKAEKEAEKAAKKAEKDAKKAEKEAEKALKATKKAEKVEKVEEKVTATRVLSDEENPVMNDAITRVPPKAEEQEPIVVTKTVKPRVKKQKETTVATTTETN